MKLPAIVVLLITMIVVSQSHADYYRYADQHGNMIYTDDLNLVPVDRRSNVEVLKGKNMFVSGSPSKKVTKTTPKARKKDDQKDDQGQLLIERQRLKILKKELDEEEKALLILKSKIRKEQQMAKTPGQIKSVNEKAVRFNTRFEAYQQKKAAYQYQFEEFIKEKAVANMGTEN